jgi:hypothetical protein
MAVTRPSSLAVPASSAQGRRLSPADMEGVMPHVAFYRVVSDQRVLEFPSEGDTQTLEFQGTGDMVVNTSSARPMVSFQMHVPSNNETSRVTLEVLILDIAGAKRRICRHELTGSDTRSALEPFDPDWLRKGNNEVNTLIFKADVDAGALEVRNVVVFFMRDI